jgi:hypothetical protein
MYLLMKLGTTLVQEQSFPEEVRKTYGLQGTPTRWLAEERMPRDWVEPILKQSIASFYGTDFGTCLESFENMLLSRDGKRPKKHIEHRGVDKRRYVIRFGIA